MRSSTDNVGASPALLGLPLLNEGALSLYDAPSVLSLHSAVEVVTRQGAAKEVCIITCDRLLQEVSSFFCVVAAGI